MIIAILPMSDIGKMIIFQSGALMDLIKKTVRLPKDVYDRIIFHDEGDNFTEKLISLLGGTQRISKIEPNAAKRCEELEGKVKNLEEDMKSLKLGMGNVINSPRNFVQVSNQDNSINLHNSQVGTLNVTQSDRPVEHPRAVPQERLIEGHTQADLDRMLFQGCESEDELVAHFEELCDTKFKSNNES
jgi:hypothetical protein